MKKGSISKLTRQFSSALKYIFDQERDHANCYTELSDVRAFYSRCAIDSRASNYELKVEKTITTITRALNLSFALEEPYSALEEPFSASSFHAIQQS